MLLPGPWERHNYEIVNSFLNVKDVKNEHLNFYEEISQNKGDQELNSWRLLSEVLVELGELAVLLHW